LSFFNGVQVIESTTANSNAIAGKTQHHKKPVTLIAAAPQQYTKANQLFHNVAVSSFEVGVVGSSQIKV